MPALRRFLLRVLTALWPHRAEADLGREVQAHLALLEDDFVAKGMDREAARHAARRAFGGVEQAKESQRDARSLAWLDDLRRDVPYAMRSLLRAPATTMAAVLALALGVGATTAVFTLFDGVLLKPLAVTRPDQLRVMRQAIYMGRREAKASTLLPYELFVQLRATPEVFSDVIAFAPLDDAILAANDREIRLAGGGVFVSDNYFEVLGVNARRGRMLAGADPQTDLPAVLGHSAWLNHFGGDSSAIGRRIAINDAPFTIVGVAPSSFFGLVLGDVPDVFLPLEAQNLAQPSMSILADRRNWSVEIVGRILPGVADAVAGERLTLFRGFTRQPMPGSAKHVLEVQPIINGLSDVRARFAEPLTLLLALGVLLLLIACANVATLLGARAASRRSEIVIRAAIGAGKGRLLRQFAAESLILAVIAGATGAVFASWATNVLLTLLPQGSTPTLFDLALDGRSLVFCVAISMLTALIAGVVPALRAAGFDLSAALRDRSPGAAGSDRRVRAFAIVQVALSVVLVIASTMFAETLVRLTRTDLGFDAGHLLQATVDPGARLYRGPELDHYYEAVFDRLEQLPGVTAATSSQMLLLDDGRTTGTVAVPGGPELPQELREAQIFQVGPEFFRTTGIGVVRGRDFSADDLRGRRRVAALNEAAARLYFGDRDPLGRTVSSGGDYEVIAIVQAAKYNTVRDNETAALFVPYPTTRQRGRMHYLIRTEGPPEDAIGAVSAAIHGPDPLVPLRIAPMRVFVDRSLSQERLLTMLSIFFAAAALTLLSVSLYGLMMCWVAERTTAIGVHLALGANRSNVRWVVIRQPLWLAGLGIAAGLPVAILGARLADRFLFGVGLADPLTLAIPVGIVVAVTAIACLPAAHRATRIDPMTALRCE